MSLVFYAEVKWDKKEHHGAFADGVRDLSTLIHLQVSRRAEGRRGGYVRTS